MAVKDFVAVVVFISKLENRDTKEEVTKVALKCRAFSFKNIIIYPASAVCLPDNLLGAKLAVSV